MLALLEGETAPVSMPASPLSMVIRQASFTSGGAKATIYKSATYI